jgi:AcrR family transcriptional regulator
VQKRVDSRRARSEATQNALKRAAERLISVRGVENVSIREILTAAGQKNESALQYHFKNLSGLLSAIHAERSEQVQTKRAETLAALLDGTPTPTLRQICTLMVLPTFELARSSVAFRRYIKAFGHELALSETSPLKHVSTKGGGGASGQQVGQLLRQALPHLDEDAYRRRMEAAIMLCSVAMYQQARQPHAFRGVKADLFLHGLIDALVGLLSAPISAETRALTERAHRP